MQRQACRRRARVDRSVVVAAAGRSKGMERLVVESDARKEAPGLLRESEDDRVVCRSIAGEMH